MPWRTVENSARCGLLDSLPLLIKTPHRTFRLKEPECL
jgi:hypothetical protein